MNYYSKRENKSYSEHTALRENREHAQEFSNYDDSTSRCLACLEHCKPRSMTCVQVDGYSDKFRLEHFERVTWSQSDLQVGMADVSKT